MIDQMQKLGCLILRRSILVTIGHCIGATTVCLLFMCVTVTAQQRIDGTVTDRTSHSPLVGATVKLEGDVLPSPYMGLTGADGRFSFAALSPGRYTVSVSAEQFYAEQVTVALSPRATQQLEFELSPVASIREEMTVNAQVKLLDETQAATSTTLNLDQINRLPAAQRTQLTDIIPTYVSGTIAGHDNLVHARGYELSLNMFINGVSFFDNPSQLFTPGLAPDIIQSVNVVTGGFPAEFGNRFGGILDIVTRSGFDMDHHGSVTLGVGEALRHNVAFDYGGHTERFGYLVYAQGFQSNRFINTPDPQVFHDFGRGSRGLIQLDYRPDGNDFFKLVLTGGGTNFELPHTADDEYYRRDAFQRNREQTAIFSWDHFFSASSALSTSCYERYVSTRLVPTTDPFSILAGGRRINVTLGAKSDYSLYLGSRHAIKTGVDLMQLRLREDVFFDPREPGFFGLGAALVLSPFHGGGTPEKFNLRGRNRGGQVSGYFQDQIRLVRNLTANLGLRYDHYSLVTSGQAVSPRLNLAYAVPGAHTVLHFAYNRFFSPPPIENLLLSTYLGVDGQPPQISRSHHFEAGASHSIRDKLRVRLTAYWRSDRNSYETVELADVRLFAPTSFARGKAYGIELSSDFPEIRPLGLSGYFSYTAQRVFQAGPITGGFPLEDFEAGREHPAAFDQIHTSVAGLLWRESRSGLWTSVGFEYGSGTPLETQTDDGEDVIVRLPSHFITNFSVGIDLFRQERHSVSLQFNVENATDRVYQITKQSVFAPVQYSPPRFLSGSLKFRF